VIAKRPAPENENRSESQPAHCGTTQKKRRLRCKKGGARWGYAWYDLVCRTCTVCPAIARVCTKHAQWWGGWGGWGCTQRQNTETMRVQRKMVTIAKTIFFFFANVGSSCKTRVDIYSGLSVGGWGHCSERLNAEMERVGVGGVRCQVNLCTIPKLALLMSAAARAFKK